METADDGSIDRIRDAWPGADGRASRRRRVPWWISVGALVCLVVLVITASVLSGSGRAATPSASGSAGPAPSASVAPRPTSSTVSSGGTAPAPGDTPVSPLPAGLASPDAASADLVALADRLPAGVSLAAPAAWAGAAPVYADPIDGCPHIAAVLGEQLGGRWTYAFGTLPQGPVGCSWVPVPYVPDRPPADRFFLTVGFEKGSVADLLTTAFDSGSSTPCPRLEVAAVAEGAVLTGCDVGGVVLALPDAGGTGVWYLSSGGGEDQRTYSASDGLLALVDAVQKAYR